MVSAMRILILDTLRYLNQQKHFISGRFYPLYFETNVDMFSQFIVNLGLLVLNYPREPSESSPAYLRLAFSARRT